jgi:site-specific DNA-methyltransferase (cytosine-N4-specific)
MKSSLGSAKTTHFTSPVDSLARINWDFEGRAKGSDLESLHPYPAKFIPDLPSTVLDALPLPRGTSVLDPFVGSGTTLVECQRRGVPSVGIDLNPIACLIARVKTAPLPGGFDDALDELLCSALKARRASIPEIPNLDHWFEKPIQVEIARIVGALEEAPAAFRDIFRLALSSILVRISNQDSDTRYAAVRKNIEAHQVPTFFATACRRTVNALKKRDYALAPSMVLERDTLAVAASELGAPIGAVITSPPYPNAYEYWLYHKYRMFWLGFDPLDVKQREIGARAHFFKTNHHTANHFVQQMGKTFELIDAVLAPNGYACFVVGRSKIHGAIVDNAAIIENAAADFGFKPVYKAERAIAANRKSFNLSHANIRTETVLVLAK